MLLALLLANQTLNAQTWTQQTSNTDSLLWDVSFINNDTGLVCGNYGIILKTTDGGANWISQNSGITNNLGAIQFVDENTAYAAAAFNNTTLLKSTDGGNVWNDISLNLTNRYGSGIWFVNADTGFYSFGEGYYSNRWILKTTNGGTNWDTVYSGTGWLSYFFFPDADNGYATITDGIVLKTTDGGTSWTQSDLGDWQMSGVFFFDKDNGFVGGGWIYGDGAIYKTNDGGNNWQSILTGYSISKIFFADLNLGFAIDADPTGVGPLIKTTDGGNNWGLETIPQNRIGGIYFPSSNIGYAVGASGVILKYTDFSDINNMLPSLNKEFSVYPNPSNGITIITYKLEEKKEASLSVATLNGKELKQITLGVKMAGNYKLNCRDFAPGVYLVTLITDSGNLTEKLIIK